MDNEKESTQTDNKQAAIDRGDELSKQFGVPVHTMIFYGQKSDGEYDENDLVVGFIKEPPFLVKARAMDKSLMGMGFTASIEILDSCLIKEQSDERILCESPGKDKYRLGAAEYCRNKILIARDQSEKKS
ncbi:hypothetical protein [Mucilaginibacter sp. 10I4]|uniref:hypothetical protein n=1 Tax=Mucilaginibacter sp. 10I4 TaxID=3048580 RepID=UPI002B23D820|nr:hypothetical protein [Mucilaginibacter sp. 10I4]MEB0262300.1 hypothetical protein [Mucilaginibacter sp. 10I4]